MPTNLSDRPRIFLDNVHFKGFKSIEDLSINFQKGLNILIGKNGAGKSNFMEFLYEIIFTKPDSRRFYNYARLRFVTEDNQSIITEFEKKLNSRHRAEEDLDDRITIHEKLYINSKAVYDNSSDGNAKDSFVFNNRRIVYKGNIRSILVRLGYRRIHPIYIRFNLSESLSCIDTPGTIKINYKQKFDFWQYSNTLDFIDDIFWALEISLENSGSLGNIVNVDFQNELQSQIPAEILENLRLFTPIESVRFNKNINIYKDEKLITIDNIKLEFKINGNWLPWSQLSDGTKRLFYVIAEVTNAEGLILIEEPELSIHPHQFNLLMDFLKEQSEHKQIIISTHSPKALDHLSQDELNSILIAYYDLKKGTQIRHLTAKEITKAKKYMKEVGFFSDYWLLSDLEE